jgi:bifunctional non-homologous end joining protein LigD
MSLVTGQFSYVISELPLLPVITHPEKVLFPDDGITKGDLAAYYEMIAPVMLPHIVRRPVTMERFPAGIDKKGFLQKDVSKGFPEWLERVEVPKKAKAGGVVHHPLVTDRRSLLWLVNQNCITPHVWVSRSPELYYPDICVFDLDPSVEDAGMLVRAALLLRGLLDEIGLPSWVKTSGSKGFHIAVPLDGKTRIEEVEKFAHSVGALAVKRDPGNLTQEFHKADRGRRILVDTGRNGWTATHAAVYAVRAKSGAPVSAPCTWEELESGKVGPRTFTLRNMAARIGDVGDLWAGMRRRRRSLERALVKLKGEPRITQI